MNRYYLIFNIQYLFAIIGHTNMYNNHIKQQSMDRPGKVANPDRGQLKTSEKNNIFLSPFAPENVVSRDGFGRLVPSQPANSPHLS